MFVFGFQFTIKAQTGNVSDIPYECGGAWEGASTVAQCPKVSLRNSLQTQNVRREGKISTRSRGQPNSPFKTRKQTHRHTDTHTDKSIETQTHRHTHRHTDRHTGRHTDTQTGTQTHRQADRQAYRQTDTQTHRHTDTQTHTQTH